MWLYIPTKVFCRLQVEIRSIRAAPYGTNGGRPTRTDSVDMVRQQTHSLQLPRFLSTNLLQDFGVDLYAIISATRSLTFRLVSSGMSVHCKQGGFQMHRLYLQGIRGTRGNRCHILFLKYVIG